MSPIRPEMRALYPPRDVWAGIRARLLARATVAAEILAGAEAPRCECDGGCGSPSCYPGARCPELHGQAAATFNGPVILTIAHLDHDPTNNDERTNLRALCQRCHLNLDAEHHAETRAAARHAELAAMGQLRIDVT